jgi:hypothetical protein
LLDEQKKGALGQHSLEALLRDVDVRLVELEESPIEDAASPGASPTPQGP